MKKNTFENYVKEYCWDLAAKGDKHGYKRCRHACVLTYGNVIVSSGVNVNLHNDFTKSFNDLKTLHAEPAAILRAMRHHSKIIHKCDLWVCRNNVIGTNSHPCKMCMRIIKSFGIKKIHYTNSNGEWANENI